MATKVKTFDAVKLSRELREATSRRLEAMSRKGQLAHLKKAGERHRAEVRTRAAPAASLSP